jgi:Arc/MetJ-type ribon-helix-helix transcriptional regulator
VTSHTRIPFRYSFRMAQVVVRLDDRLAAAVDELVSAGVVANRSEAVRLGLQNVVDHYRRAQVARRIVEGYQRHPQNEAEVGWADEATRRMIADEVW